MNAINTDCTELNDYGIDPVALSDWIRHKQHRLVLNAAFPRTSTGDRAAMLDGSLRLEASDDGYQLTKPAQPEHIVPAETTYYPPLDFNS